VDYHTEQRFRILTLKNVGIFALRKGLFLEPEEMSVILNKPKQSKQDEEEKEPKEPDFSSKKINENFSLANQLTGRVHETDPLIKRK